LQNLVDDNVLEIIWARFLPAYFLNKPNFLCDWIFFYFTAAHPAKLVSTTAMFRAVLVAAIAGTAAAFAPSAPLGRATTGRAVGVYPP